MIKTVLDFDGPQSQRGHREKASDRESGSQEGAGRPSLAASAGRYALAGKGLQQGIPLGRAEIEALMSGRETKIVTDEL